MCLQTSPQQSAQAGAPSTLPTSTAALPSYSDAQVIRLCGDHGVQLIESATGWKYQIPSAKGAYDVSEVSYVTEAQAAHAAAAIFHDKEMDSDYQCRVASLSDDEAVSICKANGVVLVDTPIGWDWACGAVISDFTFEDLGCTARHAIFVLSLKVPAPQ